jgi:prophage regulatory protein
MDRVIRLKELVGLVGLRHSAIYAGIRAGTFPRPVLIGKRAVAWREVEVEAWLAARPVKDCTRVHGQAVPTHSRLADGANREG